MHEKSPDPKVEAVRKKSISGATSKPKNESVIRCHWRSYLSSITTFGQVFLRTDGLRILTCIFAHKTSSETRKIIIYKSRAIAVVGVCVHVLPVVGALSIIILNCRTSFLVYRFSSWYAILQFVAKFHEVLMQASIVAIFLGWLRIQSIKSAGIPYGALFAATQIRDISYLWSLEFWAVINASCKGWKKISFGFLVLLSVLLAASVGPSSAIAMLPRRINVKLDTISMAVGMPESQMFPARILAGNTTIVYLLQYKE